MKRLQRIKDVQERVGLSRSEIYRRLALKQFPRPVHLSDPRCGGRTVAFDADEITAWIEARLAARDGDRIAALEARSARNTRPVA